MDQMPTCGCDMFGSKEEEEEKKTSLDADGSHPKSTNDNFTEFELRFLISNRNTLNTPLGWDHVTLEMQEIKKKN